MRHLYGIVVNQIYHILIPANHYINSIFSYQILIYIFQNHFKCEIPMLKKLLPFGCTIFLVSAFSFFYCNLALPSNPMENPDNLNVGISITEPASGIIVQDQPVTFLLDVFLPKHATAITVKFGKDPKDTSISVTSKTPNDNDTFFVKCRYPASLTDDTVKVTVTLATGSQRVFTKVITVTPKQLSVAFVTTPAVHNVKVNYPDTMKFTAVTSPAGGAIFFSMKSDPVLDQNCLSMSFFGNDASVILKADSAKIYTITCIAQSGTAYDSVKVKVTGCYPSDTPVWKQLTASANAVEGINTVVSLKPFLNDTTLQGTTLTANKGVAKDSLWSMMIPWGSKKADTITITANRGDSISTFTLSLHILTGDSTAPTIKPVDPISDTVTVNKKEFTCVFSFTDSSGISGLSFKLGSRILTDTMCNANIMQCKVTGLTQGKVDTLTVTAIDGSIKKNIASLQLRITCDTTIVDIAPAVKVQPLGVSVIEGLSATFTVEAAGTNLVYLWKKNDTSITNANTANYTISATKLSDNGNYYKCVVSNSNGLVTSDSAKLTVSPKLGAPNITSDPKSNSIIEGASATFIVEADATSVQYQWQRGATDIKGENAVSYKLASATIADNNAIFRCIVSNGAGKDTSNNAILTVLPKPAVPVISTVTPGDANVIVSWGAISGATSYSLYYKEGTSVDTFITTKVSGTELTQTITGLKNGAAYAFAVTAVNLNSKSALSEIRTATPQVLVADAPILSAPVPGSGKVTLTWAAVVGALSYNVYYQSELVSTIDKSNATKTSVASVLTTVIGSLANCQLYTFGVSSVNAGGESSIGPLQTGMPKQDKPTITQPVVNQTICEGGTATISITAQVSSGTPVFRWLLNGVAIDTTTNPSAATKDLTVSASGSYTCSVTNGCSVSTVSNASALTVNTRPQAPSITSVTKGDKTAIVSWTAVSGATYNLYYNTGTMVDTLTGTKVLAVTSPYTVNSLINGTGYAFALAAVATNCQSNLSPVVIATPQVDAPTIQTHPQNASANKSGTVTLSVSASPTGISYAWYKQGNSTALSSTSSLLLSNLQYTDVGNYYVTVSNAAGNLPSDQASVMVTDNVKPVLTLVGTIDTTVTIGATFTDPKCTATDDKDGNITASVTSSSNPTFNNSVAGEYTFSYNVNDAANNSATTVNRIVRVEGWENAATDLAGSCLAGITSNNDLFVSLNDGSATKIYKLSQTSNSWTLVASLDGIMVNQLKVFNDIVYLSGYQGSNNCIGYLNGNTYVSLCSSIDGSYYSNFQFTVSTSGKVFITCSRRSSTTCWAYTINNTGMFVGYSGGGGNDSICIGSYPPIAFRADGVPIALTPGTNPTYYSTVSNSWKYDVAWSLISAPSKLIVDNTNNYQYVLGRNSSSLPCIWRNTGGTSIYSLGTITASLTIPVDITVSMFNHNIYSISMGDGTTCTLREFVTASSSWQNFPTKVNGAVPVSDAVTTSASNLTILAGNKMYYVLYFKTTGTTGVLRYKTSN